jgi:hypothetical protein
MHSATGGQLVEIVIDVRVCVFHHGNAGRSLLMDEHRNGEFPAGEHGDDVRQMGLDSLHFLGILAVVDGHFNRPAVSVEPEMMRGLS